MQARELLERILRPHVVCLTIHDLRDGPSELRLVIPDLRSSPRRSWGDWGPMYVVEVPADRPIEVERRGAHPGAPAWRLAVTHLRVESPPIAAVRRATPLVMHLPVAEAALELCVFYDAEARVASAEARDLGRGAAPLRITASRVERFALSERAPSFLS